MRYPHPVINEISYLNEKPANGDCHEESFPYPQICIQLFFPSRHGICKVENWTPNGLDTPAVNTSSFYDK